MQTQVGVRGLLALLVAALVTAGGPVTASASCPLDLGRSAPPLAGTDLTGNAQELSRYQGRWVYIDFWATWCQPCMRKLPDVVQLQRDTQGNADLAVLSVSLDDDQTENDVPEVARKLGVAFPIICDGEGWFGANAREWCVEEIPATFLVDPQGRLVARDIEPSQVKQLVEMASRDTYRPIQVQTRERLLSDSPSTGRDSYCDLQVAVELLPDSSRIRRYKLQAYYAFRDATNNISAQTAGYEVELFNRTSDDSLPVELVISPSAVSFSDREWRETPIVAEAVARPNSMPGLSATIDAGSRSCEFTLPLPRECVSIAYSLCFYDEALGKYICNGIRIMNNPL